MTLQADLFWSFRSPYSYLATRQYRDMADDYDLHINVRPVYPLAIRSPDFFKQVNPLWIPYLLKDCSRVAEQRGLGFGWPSPDPVVMNFETREISDEQPYIFHITRLGVAASRQGNGLAFIDEVSSSIFSGTVTDWHLPETLGKTVAKTGLDLENLEQSIDGNEEAFDAEIADNQKALEAAGHWGVPTFVFEGEPFFGQDRVDLALWRLKQKGLTKRS